MRKALVGTVALAAAGILGVTVAQADEMMAERMKANVTAYYHTAFIGVSADDDEINRGHGIQQNMEIQVGGSTTLDIGLTVSASMDIRPQGPDDSSVSLSGGFGAISYGNMGSAARSVPGAPWANALFNVNGGWFGVGGVDTGGGDGVSADKALMVAYSSPNFNGFTLGVSYAPEPERGLYVKRCAAGAPPKDEDCDHAESKNQHAQQIGVGLNFSQDVLGGSFSGSVTHESHTTEVAGGGACTGQCDPSVLRYGASLSIDAISIGVGGLTSDQAGGEDFEVFNAGASYSLGGGTAVGVGFANTSGPKGDTEIVSFDLGQNLSPGIDLAASVQTGTDIMENDWTAILVGTAINF